MKKLHLAFLVPVFLVFLLLTIFKVAGNTVNKNLSTEIHKNKNTTEIKDIKKEVLYIIKDTGEPYLYHFGLTEKDFKNISDAGFDVIEGNFDICASDEDVKYFLDSSLKYGLSVIMPAGSGEAEWGYECDMPAEKDQKPVWQKEKVKDWIYKWKHYENIYAWDISNEAGSVMPNADKGYFISLSQLEYAYSTVKKTDPQRLVIIRMNGWFFYDYDDDFFREGNPFSENTADIVMVNSYSNVSDYYNGFVSVVGKRAKKAMSQIDPDVDVIISLGIWQEEPLWFAPSFKQLKNDIDSALELNPLGIAFFKYGAIGSEWYLPDENKLWDAMVKIINTRL